MIDSQEIAQAQETDVGVCNDDAYVQYYLFYAIGQQTSSSMNCNCHGTRPGDSISSRNDKCDPCPCRLTAAASRWSAPEFDKEKCEHDQRYKESECRRGAPWV